MLRHFSLPASIFLYSIAVLLPYLPQWSYAASPLPAIACEYETSVIQLAQRPKRNSHTWQFWRDNKTVEIFNPHTQLTEQWSMTSKKEISYLKVFHAHKRAIEYYASDLRSLHSYPKWEKIAHLIDTKVLKQLKQTATTTLFAQQVKIYQGQLNGVDIKITWLVEAKIPAEIQRIYPDKQVILVLKKFMPLEKSTLVRPDFSQYEVMDYADIGDNEADPVLKAIMPQHDHDH